LTFVCALSRTKYNSLSMRPGFNPTRRNRNIGTSKQAMVRETISCSSMDRWRMDGHSIRDTGKYYEVISNHDSARATKLYRTFLHELGHWVDYLTKVERPSRGDSNKREQLLDLYFSRPHDEREVFAHRYTDELRTRLIKAGLIPFDRIDDLP
jgi:hypothetical protein